MNLVVEKMRRIASPIMIHPPKEKAIYLVHYCVSAETEAVVSVGATAGAGVVFESEDVSLVPGEESVPVAVLVSPDESVGGVTIGTRDVYEVFVASSK